MKIQFSSLTINMIPSTIRNELQGANFFLISKSISLKNVKRSQVHMKYTREVANNENKK